jgi:serine/threonine protein kinase
MHSSNSSILLPETGKKIGQYIFAYCNLIGKGNFARVYRGLHVPTSTFPAYQDQTVAVKAVSLDALKSKRL